MTEQMFTPITDYTLKLTIKRKSGEEPAFICYLWFSAPQIPPFTMQHEDFNVVTLIEYIHTMLCTKLRIAGFELLNHTGTEQDGDAPF